MAFLFGHRRKSPPELVKSTKKHIDIISQEGHDEKTLKKSLEKISHNLSSMKFMLYGDAESEPKEAEQAKLVDEIFASNLLLDLIHMKRFEFEARKDVAQVYNFVLRQKKAQAVEYVKQHPEILRALVDGYNDAEIALNSGSILREVIRHEELNEIILNDANMFDAFFEFVQLSTFDVASDAFATFKLMLTKHKVLCAKFLDSHFDSFCAKYNVLLQSRNYVTKRQSLKLLGELLLNRSNFSIMMRYINNPENLKIMMNLLRGNCFPQADHQLLTRHGFVGPDEARRRLQDGTLDVATWIDGAMVYQAAVDISESAADEEREHVLLEPQCKRDAGQLDLGISLAPTDNHRMFARVGAGESDSTQWAQVDCRAQLPPLSIHEAGGLHAIGQKEPNAVMQLMAYCPQGLEASGETLPFVEPLELHTDAQIDAFVSFYGYWLAAGSLNECSVLLTPPVADKEVESLFAALPVPLAAHTDEQGRSSLAVRSDAWLRFFADQHATVAHFPVASCTPAAPRLADWVYRGLGVRRLRLLLTAMQRASGEQTENTQRIIASCPQFREQVLQLALHAGYSACFETLASGDVAVSFTSDPAVAEPKLRIASSCRVERRRGAVWCVTVPEVRGQQLIFVRRAPDALNGAAAATAASSASSSSSSSFARPLVVGNTKAIQFEAFHVFKIFVANPKKSPGVVEILSRNKRKLLEFLAKFQKDKDGVDEQFNEEKQTLINTLNQMEDLSEPAPAQTTPPAAAAASSSSSSSSAGEAEATPASAPVAASAPPAQ